MSYAVDTIANLALRCEAAAARCDQQAAFHRGEAAKCEADAGENRKRAHELRISGVAYITTMGGQAVEEDIRRIAASWRSAEEPPKG